MHRTAQHRTRTLVSIIKGDVRHLPSSIKWTVASIAVYTFGWGFADPFFSLYLNEFSDQYAVIGLYLMLATLTGALALIPLGDLLDRASHRTVITIAKAGYVLVGIGYFFAGANQSVPLLVVALLMNGAFGAAVWSGTSATLRDNSTKKNSTITFGFYTTARQLTWIIGLLLGMWLIIHYPIYYIFIPVTVMPVVSMLLGRKVKVVHHEPLGKALQDILVKDKLIGRFIREMREFNGEMWLMFFFFFASYLIPVFAVHFIPLFAKAQGYSLLEIGLLVLAMNLPYLFSFIAAEIADHSERLRNIVIGFGVSAVSLAALSIWNEHSWQLMLLMFCFMAGYAIIIPSVSGVATMLTPKRYTGTSTAAIDLVIFGAAIVLSPVFGILIDTFGWNSSFLIIAITLAGLMILTVGTQHYFKKRNRLYHLNNPHTNHEPFIV